MLSVFVSRYKKKETECNNNKNNMNNKAVTTTTTTNNQQQQQQNAYHRLPFKEMPQQLPQHPLSHWFLQRRVLAAPFVSLFLEYYNIVTVAITLIVFVEMIKVKENKEKVIPVVPES